MFVLMVRFEARQERIRLSRFTGNLTAKLGGRIETRFPVIRNKTTLDNALRTALPRFCKQQVAGSIPSVGSSVFALRYRATGTPNIGGTVFRDDV